MTDFCELAPKATPLDYPTVVNAVLVSGAELDLNFSRAAAKVATAQIALETGMRTCPNYCIAGEKARPNNGLTHWQYFATRENLSAAKLAQAMGLGPLKVLGETKPGVTSVMLYPKHPWCCFVAFESLDQAMRHHFEMLAVKFALALSALKTGDPVIYAKALRKGKYGAYYTALESEYVNALKIRMRELETKCPPDHLVWGDVL
jgi:hypothetical protein